MQPMWADNVLEEVRSVRAAQAAAFGYDVRATVADLRRREGRDGRCVMQPPTKVQAPAEPESCPAEQLS
jgi:hypothetical protein